MRYKDRDGSKHRREAALERFRLVPEQPCDNDYLLDHIARTSLGKVDGGYTWKFDPRIFQRIAPRPAEQLLSKVQCRVALFRAEYAGRRDGTAPVGSAGSRPNLASIAVHLDRY